jgi:hypothetical protein
MVGQCDRRRALFCGTAAKALDATRSVEEGVFRMDVEMNELAQP